MKQATTLAVMLVAVLAVAAGARGAPIVSEASADSFVRAGSSNVNTNYNSGSNLPYLDVKSQSGDMQYTRKSYARFDLTDAPDTVTEATLTLTNAGFLGSSSSSKVWTFEVYGLLDNFVPGSGILGNTWGESAITWNNAPANNTASAYGVIAGSVYGGAPLGTFTITGTGSVGATYSISGSALVDFLNSDTDGLGTFIIVRPTDGDTTDSIVHRFASRENATYSGPQLSLLPEPATLVLLGLGAGVTYLSRRRRSE